jgi:hypothetical protein
MSNSIQVTQVTSSNCGGKGAWIDNPLNSPRPGNGDWLGFQLGGGVGGGGGRKRKPRKMRKTRQVRKRRMSRKTKKRKSKFRMNK